MKNGGKEEIRGYGDMSLTELLPALLTSYNETELMIVAPTIPDQAAKIISKWAKWQWFRRFRLRQRVRGAFPAE